MVAGRPIRRNEAGEELALPAPTGQSPEAVRSWRAAENTIPIPASSSRSDPCKTRLLLAERFTTRFACLRHYEGSCGGNDRAGTHVPGLFDKTASIPPNRMSKDDASMTSCLMAPHRSGFPDYRRRAAVTRGTLDHGPIDPLRDGRLQIQRQPERTDRARHLGELVTASCVVCVQTGSPGGHRDAGRSAHRAAAVGWIALGGRHAGA